MRYSGWLWVWATRRLLGGPSERDIARDDLTEGEQRRCPDRRRKGAENGDNGGVCSGLSEDGTFK